ncbi:zinc-dependent metalloprotease [Hymenobacter cellulosivorans]|uniref:M12 family metallo-peptidase n=1 Tax=Hymenobacter cellulosivorans TaxID=2932249 RepID=A0ABY4F8I3_9BACT|nr:zinc-dependent metalloprotease [Hymenobacter cellulosivorans]UOQ52229.1 M12 family metallo-peptidase [Hymenobacter cellulosivorans]
MKYISTRLFVASRALSVSSRTSLLLGTGLFFGVIVGAQAQQKPTPVLFRDDAAARSATADTRLAQALRHSRPVTLALADLRTALAPAPREVAPGLSRPGQAPVQVALPLPDGTTGRFQVLETAVMEPALAAQFPAIKTYCGVGLDDPTATVRLDLTPRGFHAQILSAAHSTVYIDPASETDHTHYLSFYRRDMPGGQMHCAAGRAEAAADASDLDSGPARRSVAPELRTYRLAVAATGEYTQYHGGTVAQGQAAIVTAVNRVVGVYERELAVRLVLVGGNAALVYTNGSTDPYSNDDGVAMLGENQTNVTTLIGRDNYDIGHVFSTGGGGIAGLGVVCLNGNKARGVTGLFRPVGDAFYIDYVAHEMGHQFGADHTFNSENDACDGNRNTSTAYEPGSGSTIMAYAGICAPDNVQNNSDAYFHVSSYEEIYAYLATTTCGIISATGNTAPVVALPASSKVLPIGTPFKLTAIGTDAEGDALTYCWEEYDLGPAADLTTAQATNVTVPLFRSFAPTTSPTRYFPRLTDLVANTSTSTERLPTVTRNLRFRVTVRDQHSGTQGVVGGLNSSPVVSLSTTNSAGPFLVTAPNSAVTWASGSTQTVTWNVAGTSANGVNCATVNLRLSTDGGLTYPTLLLANTPNDGSQAITVPGVGTTAARVMVEAADNYFFDISNTNFTISAPLPVELVTFAAECQRGAVQLDWHTASEENSARFEVERSVDGSRFEHIGTVPAAGHSTSTRTYTFRDPNQASALSQLGTRYYRLRQVDQEGTAEYSPVRTVQVVSIPAGLALFPNPTTHGATLAGAAPGTTVRLIDSLGRVVLTADADATGQAVLSWPAQALAAGMYVVQAGQRSVRLSIVP